MPLLLLCCCGAVVLWCCQLCIGVYGEASGMFVWRFKRVHCLSVCPVSAGAVLQRMIRTPVVSPRKAHACTEAANTTACLSRIFL